MNEPQNSPEGMLEPSLDEMQGELQSLRTLVSVTLILLIVFSFCVNAFLFKQVSNVNSLTNASIQQAEFAKQQATAFWNKLDEYSRTDAEFMHILDKYRPAFITNSAPPSVAPKKK